LSAALRGVGLALVEVPRFRAALERRGERMLARVFSDAELEYARRKKSGWQNLARPAAKCAGRAAPWCAGRTRRSPRLGWRLRNGEPRR
jgi:phosphopantetheinyl transferase (holo-ACP synthase)